MLFGLKLGSYLVIQICALEHASLLSSTHHRVPLYWGFRWPLCLTAPCAIQNTESHIYFYGGLCSLPYSVKDRNCQSWNWNIFPLKSIFVWLRDSLAVVRSSFTEFERPGKDLSLFVLVQTILFWFYALTGAPCLFHAYQGYSFVFRWFLIYCLFTYYLEKNYGGEKVNVWLPVTDIELLDLWVQNALKCNT